MSRIFRDGANAALEGLCKDCAYDAGKQWPVDTRKNWCGLCQSCGENEGTLVAVGDMEDIADLKVAEDDFNYGGDHYKTDREEHGTL